MTILIAALIAAATPGGFEDIAKLEARTIAALDAGIGIPGGPVAAIDRRLRLARCPAPVTIDPPALGAVALRCAQLGWRIRVPQVGVSGGASGQARAAPVVRRGDPVEVRAEGRAFSVVGSAIADEDGAQGARIRVRTDRTRPPVVAEVVDVGVVRIAAR